MAGKVIDKDLGWAAVFKRVYESRRNVYAKVGVLADSEKGGMRLPGAALTVAEIAAIHEFGTENQDPAAGLVIPPRSFVRSTFDEQRPALIEESKKLMAQILAGTMNAHQANNILGAKLAAEIKKKVTTGAGVPPPLKPGTIAAKGSERPLVDTGRMINAVTWAVVEGGE